MRKYAICLTVALYAVLPSSSIAEPEAKHAAGQRQASSIPRPGEPRTPLPDDIIIAAKDNRVELSDKKSALARLGASIGDAIGGEAQLPAPSFFFTDTVAAFSRAITQDKLMVTIFVTPGSEYSKNLLQQIISEPLVEKFKDCAVFVVADVSVDEGAKKMAGELQLNRLPVTAVLIPKKDNIFEQAHVVGSMDGQTFIQALKNGILGASVNENGPASLKANPVAVCPALGNVPANLS